MRGPPGRRPVLTTQRVAQAAPTPWHVVGSTGSTPPLRARGRPETDRSSRLRRPAAPPPTTPHRPCPRTLRLLVLGSCPRLSTMPVRGCAPRFGRTIGRLSGEGSEPQITLCDFDGAGRRRSQAAARRGRRRSPRPRAIGRRPGHRPRPRHRTRPGPPTAARAVDRAPRCHHRAIDRAPGHRPRPRPSTAPQTIDRAPDHRPRPRPSTAPQTIDRAPAIDRARGHRPRRQGPILSKIEPKTVECELLTVLLKDDLMVRKDL